MRRIEVSYAPPVANARWQDHELELPSHKPSSVDDASMCRAFTDEVERVNDALGRYIALIGECVRHCDDVRGRLDGHLGVSPDKVTWSHVADVSRVLEYLRLAAHAAGVGPEPESY